MLVNPTYPGVYINEVPSGVRTIMGVRTSVTAFIGYLTRGPMGKAVKICSFADFERAFGGLHKHSELSYAVQQFFLNGGTEAWIIRSATGGSKAKIEIENSGSLALNLEAKSTGVWGDSLRVVIDQLAVNPKDKDYPDRFNLTVMEVDGEGDAVRSEVFCNLSLNPDLGSYVKPVVNNDLTGSDLIEVADGPDGLRTLGELKPAVAAESVLQCTLAGGSDGIPPDGQVLIGSQASKSGIFALDDVEFNLLCIPRTGEVSGDNAMTEPEAKGVISAAAQYCATRRAFLIVDPPDNIEKVDTIIEWFGGIDKGSGSNAAVYFPQVKVEDPLNEFRLRSIGPSGTIAGLYARTDSSHGIWQAPAGVEAPLRNVRELKCVLSDPENETLNQLGVNCLRNFPVVGNVCWGARTLRGADQLTSEWKYVPVRRVALYIEESLFREMQWIVFEPNDEPLWAMIHLNVGAFMHNLFRQGAFQGTTPRDAYFVKCDKETTTQNDITQGIVNIFVGFAPLKPAEFVIIKISRIAAKIQT